MEDRILDPAVLTWDELTRHWWSWVSLHQQFIARPS